jgi:ADP-ribose pyrophosphatase YjhB (NUDIX family)
LTFDLAGERAPRCPACRNVRYRNPAVGVAVIVRDAAGRVLLGRRAKGDSAGLRCIPCGYVEWGEEVRAAAEREFEEETGLTVRAGAVEAVHSNFHNAKQLTVGVWFAGEVLGGELEAHDGELDALEYFPPEAPPPLAFPTDAVVLRDLAHKRRGDGQ